MAVNIYNVVCKLFREYIERKKSDTDELTEEQIKFYPIFNY